MEKIMIFIKHHFKFLWKIIQWLNDLFFKALYFDEMEKVLTGVLMGKSESSYVYRKLEPADSGKLYDLVHSQQPGDLNWFNPHGFDLESIMKQFKIKSFLMMGTFHRERLIGYFFLRFFSNRKCFVGRLIDREYRGKGIGLVMNEIMYRTAWSMGFHCLSTISRDNTSVMKAHSKNPNIKIIKELNNNYLLIEFVTKKS